MKDIKLTKKAFIAWLETKPRAASVGHSLSARFCPLANYMTEKGEDCVRVMGPTYKSGAPRDKARYKVLPLWAQRFVRRVDELEAHMEYPESVAVTAGEALEICRSKA